MSSLAYARVTIPWLADLLGVSRAWVGQLQKQGAIPKTDPSGTVQLGASLRRYTQHITCERADGRAALVEEQTRKIRNENDGTESNLAATDTLQAAAVAMLDILDAELANWADRVPAAARAGVGREVEMSRQRIHAAMRAALRDALAGDDESGEAV